MMDWIDNLLGVFNWINVGGGLLRQAVEGNRAVRFAIKRPDKGGAVGRPEVRDLLESYHIATFGSTFDADRLYFSVLARQSRWAAYVLTRAGIEFESVADPGVVASAGLPPRWDDRTRGRSGRPDRRVRRRALPQRGK